MALQEADVLQPLDEVVKTDQNQWPEFQLKNVKIVRQENGVPASLLAAHGGNLLRVEGVLGDIDAEYAHLVKLAKYRNRTIRIDDVALYSFSQYDDGTLGFWAAGKAGWFEIGSPAPRYKTVFEGMNEATGMFYFLADKYRNSRSKLSKESNRVVDSHVRHVFYDYGNSDYCKRRDSEDIKEGFYEHHNFLIKSMIEGQDGLEWETAPVFRHLKRQFPADFKTMQSIVSGQPVPDEEEKESEPEPLPTAKSIRKGVSKGRSTRSGSSAQTSQQLEDEELESGLTTPPRKGKRKSYLRPRSERSSKRFTRHDIRTQSATQDDADIHDSSEDDGPGTLAASLFVAKDDGTGSGALTVVDPMFPTRRAPVPAYYEPHGPGDTWTCPYDGCNFKVWEGRKPKSLEMMKNHFGDTHANPMEDLIHSESRPWSGVSHLLQRLKGLVSVPVEEEKQLPSDQALPERIVKRY